MNLSFRKAKAILNLNIFIPCNLIVDANINHCYSYYIIKENKGKRKMAKAKRSNLVVAYANAECKEHRQLITIYDTYFWGMPLQYIKDGAIACGYTEFGSVKTFKEFYSLIMDMIKKEGLIDQPLTNQNRHKNNATLEEWISILIDEIGNTFKMEFAKEFYRHGYDIKRTIIEMDDDKTMRDNIYTNG